MTLESALQSIQPGLAGGGLLPAIGTTFLAGILASAVCPCTLPVGLSVAGMAGASDTGGRHDGLAIASAFFVGIVGSLTALGLFAGQLGALATESFGRNWALVMAILSFAAAGLAFWRPRLPFDKLTAWRRPGVAGAFGYGLVFSLGTSVAPLLLLFTIVAASGAPKLGVLLAFFFGIGRGLPFLLAGVVASTATRFTRLGLLGRPIQFASGIALVFVGWYYAQVYAALL
ncbi:cytochrome c biogenesis protein CcdA [Devosia sp. 66-22]|uniref:cytochrome c biogenesis CcdA family protein n=1 Tax=Devosia sp. 66-22 TaxID=1895753 RepID=UPI0009288E75|nr:cytochrome c biogenesis protein CcdA [Devosia sp. 66-22]OJX48437.1 MAG: thiol:disulfide interchange protein [Devosia sp. 66-22]